MWKIYMHINVFQYITQNYVIQSVLLIVLNCSMLGIGTHPR